MAAQLGSGGDQAIVDINITPFVDIILVILIIFMVTSVAIVRKAIKVDLPDAASGESTGQTSLGLLIDGDLRWYLDGEPISRQRLQQALRSNHHRASAAGEEVVCLVSADESVPYGEVIRLVDVVKSEGIARFALDIDPTLLDEDATEP